MKYLLRLLVLHFILISTSLAVPEPPATEINGPADVCQEMIYTYQLLEFSGECNWTVSGGDIISGQGTGRVRVEWGSPGQAYLVAEQPSEDDLPGRDSLPVTICPDPNPDVIPNKYVLCGSNDLIISTDVPFEKYYWSTGATSASITISEVGLYYVEVQNSIGCWGYSDTILVTRSEIPSPVITGSFEKCPGEATLIGLTEEYEKYAWSTGQKTPEIEVIEPGIYYVTVTDTNNCTAEAEFTITDIPTQFDGLSEYDLGLNSSRTITITNRGDRDSHVEEIYLKYGASFVLETEPQLPTDIGPGESIDIFVQVMDGVYGHISDSIMFDISSPCRYHIPNLLSAYVPPRVLVWLPHKEVEMGQNCIIPIKARCLDQAEISGSFDMEYTCVPDYMAPLNTGTRLDGQFRYINHSSSAEISTDSSVIGETEARIYLSNSEYTDLIIDSFDWTGDPCTIIYQQGRLTTKSFCAQNFLKFRLMPVPLRILPNPAGESADIVLDIEQKGNVDICICDIMGRPVQKISYCKQKKYHKQSINLSRLAPGAYYMIVTMSNGQQLQQVLVRI